ncbi:MAG TPA: NAD(P)/FAD-dependent oxidoreductase [Thermoplasmata archaeon]|nr:NAD(P)/FAD-dependent oxidoreductase [Thermoplasmata archaeon]
MAERIEVAVIGAGPAGISAAIFLKRAGANPVLFEKNEVGGLLRNANLVENYPGFPKGIGGRELAALFARQLKEHAVAVSKAEVSAVGASKLGFKIEADSGGFIARVVIVCTGTRPKDIGLKGEHDLVGKRIFHEIADLPPLGKKRAGVLIIGGGDAAFDYSMNLSGRGHDVTIISRSEPTCLALLRERAEEGGVGLIEGSVPLRVREVDGGLALTVRGKGRLRELETDYILIACGRGPELSMLDDDLKKRIGGLKDPPRTRVPGLFICGDAVRGIHRQTGIAVGDGVLAAMLAMEFLEGRRVAE